MPGGALDETQALKALLEYYRAIGVDFALDESPHDRFAQAEYEIAAAEAPESSPAPPPPGPVTREAPPRALNVAAPLTPQAALEEAETIANAAATLEELREGLAGFEGGRASRARHFLFSSGSPAPLMALDYAPGEAEESGGEAFSGAEARLLDAMMAAIGRGRTSAYYAYFSPWRPAGGQPLAPHVTAALAPFALRHIALARPKAVLLLGDTARIVLGGAESPARLYARKFELQAGAETVVAVPAPGLAAMRKTPSLKRHAWRALRTLALILES
ncbi:uracil-DNA glycosylase family protein [Methylocystis heyeri]|uniref:Uracil-DNA glycosylase n=1 Tax=Methylocystis heyeri TaxID=391905 RepID=A0A6B8KH82_9HYPH|nr:uracil-DNA glycosylase family protein [Methylocystis heyeri]QGM46982.1 uracil-DNA glycosylase [Methylocystis heyeri]